MHAHRLLRLAPLLILAGVAIAGCAESHGRVGGGGDDAGARGDGGGCAGPMPFLFCVSDCGSDAGEAPICSGGAWACPPGTRDASTCPPTCVGPPPGAGCACVGTEWRCDGSCPADLGPGDACSVEGAECSRTGTCGAGLFCTCRDHVWQCGIGDPDPVCDCGREPSEGDPCLDEGATCGACCPTPGGPSWAPFVCSGGRWTAAACPAIACPVELSCPASTASVLGQPCAEGETCGDACCGDAIVCSGGRWVSGPIADCLVCSGFACGDGSCHDGQSCRRGCGPTDGPEYFCDPLPLDCESCDCLAVPPSATCEMIDGRTVVRELGCG